jgi:multisubunit Na+/H+ antiporter MnhF subunit
MIDTWFFAAFCLILIVLAAVVRMVRISMLYDRFLAAALAVTVACMAGLFLSIGLGNLQVLDITIILALLAYAAVIGFGMSCSEVDA